MSEIAVESSGDHGFLVTVTDWQSQPTDTYLRAIPI